MNKITQVLANPIVVLTLATCTILSIVLTVIFYFKSKKVRKLTYFIESNNLINNEKHLIDNIKILYNDNNIKNLTISKVSVWNAGKDTVNYTDVAPIEPIKLCLPSDCTLLNAKIIKANEPANNASFEISGNNIMLSFDYFDFNDFIIIQIIHTGLEDIEIKGIGKIKGQGAFKRYEPSKAFWVLGYIFSFLFNGTLFNVKDYIEFYLKEQTNYAVYRVHKKSGTKVKVREHRR